MKLSQNGARILVPDGTPLLEAASRVTHLGVGAHADDLEFMAFHGILACYERQDRWFGGVTCTDGAGSARSGEYAGVSDQQLCETRALEQETAARIGGYGIVLQLGHPSAALHGAGRAALVDDLCEVLAVTHPQVIYTHNPADKHGTHVAVLLALMEALRVLGPARWPQQVIGCEVWRDLDWLPDARKVRMDVSSGTDLAEHLNAVFASQIAGGKRYDLAVAGRRRAHATFDNAHASDQATSVILGMDLTPLLGGGPQDIRAFTAELTREFESEVMSKLGR